MAVSFTWRTLALATLLACAGAAVHAQAPAQKATAPELRGAFLFKFAMFTEWPPAVLPVTAPLVICVLGDPAAAAALDRYAQGRTVQTRRVVVWKGLGEGPVHACHVLYVAKDMEDEVGSILDSVTGLPVLTVGDSALFAQTRGTVQLLVENDRMRFAVNIDTVRRQKLRLSAQLLALGTIIRTPDAPPH
jgi:hypothetical protein